MARNYNVKGANQFFGSWFNQSRPGQALLGIVNPISGISNIYHNLFGGNSDNTMSLFDALYRDFTGETSQQREFEQQEYLLDKMNQFNTPENQLKRLTDAGINPHAAAAAIAGQPTESAQAPQVSTANTAPAAALGSASQAVGAINQSANNAAQRRLLDAEAEEKKSIANRTNSLLDFEKEKLVRENALLLQQEGLTYWEAYSASVTYLYADERERAHLALLMSQDAEARKHVSLMSKMMDQIDKQVEVYDAEISKANADGDLARAKALESQKSAFYTEQLGKHQELYNQGFIALGYDPSLDADKGVMVLYATGKDPSKIYDNLSKASYARSFGERAAQVDTAYNKVLAEAKAKAEVDAQYAPYFAAIENNQEVIKKMLDLYYDLNLTMDPSSWIAAILKRTNGLINGQFAPVIKTPQAPPEGDPNK